MNKIRSIIIIAVFSLSLPLSLSSWAGQRYETRQRSSIGEGRKPADVENASLRNIRSIRNRQDFERLREEINSLSRRGNNGGSRTPQVNPNDPYYSRTGSWGQAYDDLWGVKKIGLSSAVWDLYKGEGIKIGIVDTGVLLNHEDIAANIWTNPFEIAGNGIDDDADGYVDDVRGWDFVDNDNNPMDLNGHGTHVAGIAAAVGNNSKGIIGVAPMAKIIPVRVLDAAGSGTFQAVANGIRYAAKAGAHIINVSLGGGYVDAYSTALVQDAVNFARSLGSVIVAAAGNSNDNVDYFTPANLDGVIAIGATDAYDSRAWFSNYGSKLFLTAPGVDILSLGSSRYHIGTTVASNYYRASGTSMATPYVSGSLALLLNKYPGATLDFLKTQLKNGAADLGAVGWDPYYGYGRLNIAASLGIASGVSVGTFSTAYVSGSTTTVNGLARSTSVSSSSDGASASGTFDERATRKRLEEEFGLVGTG